MLDLKDRKRDKYGNVVLSEDGIVNLLYSGELDVSTLEVENSGDVQLFNKWANMFDEDLLPVYTDPTESIEEFDNRHQSNWLIPNEYLEIDVEAFLLKKCSTQIEIDRVKEEMALFREREMEVILQVLIYLVDVMRKNNIVWGVGRGSACSSYCLYLIGIHKVNSLRYNLDIKEFLK